MRSRVPCLKTVLPRSRPAARQFHAKNLAQSRNRLIQNPARSCKPPSSSQCLYKPDPQSSNSSISPTFTFSADRSYSTKPEKAEAVPSFAFAFDIDGVLLRSSEPLPGASDALKILNDRRIPFILLTNGGGKHESARVTELSKKLGINLSEENFIQSHTPFKQYVEGIGSTRALKDKTILVTGGKGDKVRQVAEMYGFKNVVTPADILMAQPTIWPFNQIFSDYYKSSYRPLPQLEDPNKQSLKIDAIFVFNDPRDWALDTQIILDLLLSKDGVLGTYSQKNGDASLPNNGWQQDGQPALYFSNPDLFWAASYHLPRLGQGAFQAAFEGVWNATTSGADLQRTVIGKPHAETYKFAEHLLNMHRAQILGGIGKEVGKLRTVYMVGDNPESDIRGANEFQSPTGAEWRSILVKTGVYSENNAPKYKPCAIVHGVLNAVNLALEAERCETHPQEVNQKSNPGTAFLAASLALEQEV